MKTREEIYTVYETIDGRVVETHLPKEQAEKLYRKIRAVGGIADIKKAVSKVKGS